jgi:Ca2+-binding RTX toxin-like protein
VTDAAFEDVDAIGWLQLTGASTVELDSFAVAAGIDTVVGGSGSDSIFASNASQGFYLSGGSAGDDTFVGSAFNDTIRGNGGIDSIETGNGDNLVIFTTSAEFLLAATVAGGTGDDTLSFTTQGQALVDANFSSVDNVEAIQFADGTGSSAVLAGLANTAGIASVYGGSGNDTLTVDETIYTGPTFEGADGMDVLILSNAAATVADSFFTNVLSVASFQTANGANDITLGAQATEASIATVTGGTGNDILNASAMTSAVTLMGGLGADTLTGGSAGNRLQGWGGTSTANTSNDTLTGGAGTDVFVLGDATGNAYGFDSNPAVNYRALITGFAMGTDRFQLWDADRSGGVTVAADGTIANQMNISVGGLQVYRFNYDNAADTGTLYVAGTTKVVAELTGFSGSGADLTTSNFTIV